MTRKSLFIIAALALAVGPARAAELPTEGLAATAIDPPAVQDISSVSAAHPVAPKPDEPMIIAQAAIPGLRPLPGFKPSGDPGKALFDLNLLALVSLNIADYVTTRQALKYPGLYEANPLMRPFAKSPAAFTAVKAGTTVLTYLGMKALFKKNRTAAWVVTTATNVFLSYVVSSNLQKIHQARAL
jgi:hypothetical protein